ncbi:hypothetical protein [Thalassospira lucentensis]|uniref:hypothetical protein n=1 Tax=Thalassospira lucentensis TaxID=168935 RepID=UPI003AA9CDE5
MGSLFSTPKPAAPAARPSAQPAPPSESESAEDAARAARQEALERRRYGRAGLIATGHRGLLSDRISSAVNGAAGGKNLLGD